MSQPDYSTPVRPSRSLKRASAQSLPTIATPNLTSSPQSPSAVTTPITPSQPPPSAFLSPSTPDLRRSKSRSSVSSRRKPVPVSLEDEYALAELPRNPFVDPQTPLTPSTPRSTLSEPPRYILPVDPVPPPPPTYINQHVRHHLDVERGVGLPTASTSREQLPAYTEEVDTEPDTLARKCWQWGFLFPLLWVIGVAILCIPLRPTEEEPDADKAQKLEEMIVILRKVEIKYAKRCAWSLGAFTAMLTLCILLAVMLTRR